MNALNQPQQKAWSPLAAFLTLASLLLAVVFAMGCSEQGLSVLSPDDDPTSNEATTLTESEQIDSKFSDLAASAGPSEATFRVTFSGDITGGPAEQSLSIKPSSSGIAVNPMTLDLSYFQTTIAGGESCFSSGEFAGPLQVHTEKNSPDPAQSHFYFWATGSDGTTEIKYVLTMNGQYSDPNNWPPAVGTQNTIVMTAWEMATGGGRKNKNIACTGEGTFSSGVTILVERIN